ncbi:SDR family oxidoreductase [Leisingera sp. HS039]|uniref:SDR family NAD(P)-dependent oxidoreductase n=1 Tax=unclassified Leisingera TaxID=2614906 RepID=UPI0010714771|nr:MULTISPECIES: SDR family NAD(P)-dependent oxidoreductase [unclassified Leisingera]MBQ4823557.1 SDR family oxidoreductase [Leisingera sp. HS039]QBR37177.1 SDR family oxidoreductase [Leisingera sp. NJS201]
MGMFSGQNILITGGGSGIGQAIARRLAGAGAKLAIADRNAGTAEATASELRDAGAEALAIEADISREADVEAMFAAVQQFGGTLHGMAHCAGIGVEKTILDTSLDDWNRLIGINLTGTFLCARGAARMMAGQGYGRILLMGSAAGERGGTGRSAYGASKGGVHALTRVMAVELAELGITVNAMAPGAIETELVSRMHDAETRTAYCSGIPANRYGAPDEVGAAAEFLLSSGAAYVSGVVLPIDGGFMGAGVIKRQMNPSGG